MLHFYVQCYISTVTEAAAPLKVCGGCQLLDTIQFCSTVVYSRLVIEMREQSDKFYFHPNDCLATAAGRNFSSSGPDCMPPPQGLPSEAGQSLSHITSSHTCTLFRQATQTFFELAT